jgi:predicted RNase H-like HicB family nuclease
VEVITKLAVIVQKEESWYVSKCPENNVASQGKTIEEALNNLREAVALYYEDEKSEIEEKQIFLTTIEVAI